MNEEYFTAESQVTLETIDLSEMFEVDGVSGVSTHRLLDAEITPNYGEGIGDMAMALGMTRSEGDGIDPRLAASVIFDVVGSGASVVCVEVNALKEALRHLKVIE